MYVSITRGKLINDKHEKITIYFLRFLSRYNYRSSIREKNRKIAIWRIACALEENGLTSRHCNSRERNWHSRLNGNRRWFVRQSSFSGLARRSFSRQLQGEKGRPLLTDLPTRFYSLWMPFYTRSFLLHSHLSARSATTRHMDAHEERLLRRTRKRPRESSSRFASLVKWTRLCIPHSESASSSSPPDLIFVSSSFFLSFSLSYMLSSSSFFIFWRTCIAHLRCS